MRTAKFCYDLQKIPRVKNNRNLNAFLSIYVNSMMLQILHKSVCDWKNYFLIHLIFINMHRVLTLSSWKESPLRDLLFAAVKSWVWSMQTWQIILLIQVLCLCLYLLDILYCPMYFHIYPYPSLLSPVCTVHYNSAPVTSATPHVWNQNSLVVSNDVHLIPWDWTLVFKRGSTPHIPTTSSSYEATTPFLSLFSQLSK